MFGVSTLTIGHSIGMRLGSSDRDDELIAARPLDEVVGNGVLRVIAYS